MRPGPTAALLTTVLREGLGALSTGKVSHPPSSALRPSPSGPCLPRPPQTPHSWFNCHTRVPFTSRHHRVVSQRVSHLCCQLQRKLPACSHRAGCHGPTLSPTTSKSTKTACPWACLLVPGPKGLPRGTTSDASNRSVRLSVNDPTVIPATATPARTPGNAFLAV